MLAAPLYGKDGSSREASRRKESEAAPEAATEASPAPALAPALAPSKATAKRKVRVKHEDVAEPPPQPGNDELPKDGSLRPRTRMRTGPPPTQPPPAAPAVGGGDAMVATPPAQNEVTAPKVKRERAQAAGAPRPFVCVVPGCDKAYMDQQGLDQHHKLKHPGLQMAAQGSIGVGSRVQDSEGICGEIVEANMAWLTMRTDAGEERKMRKMALKLVAPGTEAAPADQVAAAAKKSIEGKQRKRSSCPFTSARGKKSKKSKSREPVMSSEEAQLIASIRAGTQEYHHQGFGPDGEAYYELEDVDDEPFRDECDVCKATPSPSQRWFKCVHCIGFDLCEDCHANPTVPRHPHPLVRRPAAIDGTEAPRVSSRLTPGGGGVLVSLQVTPAGADGAASRSALRDLRLLEGLWSCRFHVKKLAATSECREDELQGLIEGALRPHASHGCNATGAPTLVLTRVEEAALKETVAGRSGKKKQMSKAQAAGAEAAAKFFKGFKCADAVRDDELWLRAMQEATTLLQHSNSSEQLPLSLRHALPPLQHGTNWDHSEDGFPGARNAASAKLLREVQEPPVTPLLLVPPAHLRAPMDIMKKTGALLTGGCAPLTGHKWNGALVCKPEAQ